MLDAVANGSLFRNTPAEAWEIIGNMAESNIGWPDVKKEKKAGVLEVDALTALNAKIDALTHQMAIMKTAPANQVQSQQPEEQQVFEIDAANFMGNQGRHQYNPYNNTYNPCWKNHPNLSWKSADPTVNTSKPVEQKPSFEEIMMKYVAGTETRLQNQEAMMYRLETQMAQIATQLPTRPEGSLPSNRVKNPRDVNAIMVVTRAQHEEPEDSDNGKNMERTKYSAVKEDTHGAEHSSMTGKKKKVKTSKFEVNDDVDVSSLPFPKRAKQVLFDHQFKKFLKIFKKLFINLSFVDVLAQMPSYAKFLKDLLKNKKKLNDITHTMNEECSAVMQNKCPRKFQDPWSFSIPCQVVSLSFENVLCDRGASINLMSHSLSKRLGISNIEPGELVLRMNVDHVVFHMLKSASDSPHSNSYSAVNFVDVFEEFFDKNLQVQRYESINPIHQICGSEARSSCGIDQTLFKRVDKPP
ncbi:uncharacterized protein [Henckelia pumila]|uniref:uncharacterized protein n=1 Tax=Henckelia pumila TaxID=405737 RepID=UPI003C6DCE0E